MKRILVSEETGKGLAVLKDDHESGAQALAVKALEKLLGFVRGDEMAKLTDPEEFWRELRWRAWHLAKNGRPSMGAAIESEVFKALAAARSDWREAGSLSSNTIRLKTMKSIIDSTIEARIAARQNSLQTLAVNFVSFVENNWPFDDNGQRSSSSAHIVTLSSSGTITQCLTRLIESSARRVKHIKLTVLESRPNFEGVSFVNKLLDSCSKDPNTLARLKIEIVSDASVAAVVENADYIVIGSDKILQDGDVSNKIGSLPAVVMAKTLNANCKVLAVFETNKILHSDFNSGHPKTEYNDPAEVTKAWPTNLLRDLREKQSQGFHLEVKNAYFEWVPARYIDRYISEEGALEVGDIAKLSVDSFNLEKGLFSDL